MKKDQKRWDERYRRRGFVFPKGPHPFLKKNLRLLPKGRALDLAAGEGRNAIFLAEKGFEVDAVDISEVALKKARQWARAKGLRIRTFVADLDTYSIDEEGYDVIANFYFLRRRLIPKIKQVLKKG
jgi:SAM-dependent methyltransferase